MARYEIPLTPEAQNFSIVLAGVNYNILVVWNFINSTWQINFSLQDGTPILTSIPLIGNTDLFEPYKYLNLGGQLIIDTPGNPDETPTFTNLGIDSKLYFITT